MPSRIVVVIIVMVSAKPYAAEICSESRNMAAARPAWPRTARTLTTGMYSWPRVRAGYRTCRCGIQLRRVASETMVNAPVISAWEAMMPAETDSTTAT